MTRDELRAEWNPGFTYDIFWDYQKTLVRGEYTRWLEDKYLRLVNGNNLDKPIFSPNPFRKEN